MKTTSINSLTEHAIIGGNKIAYRKIGQGTPIILVNRFRGTLDTWDPLFLDLLAENFTVITFDYPGIGYSEGTLPLTMEEVASVVIDLADDLNFTAFNVLGWSYGGLVAQYVTFLYPQRVLKAILIGTNPIGKNDTPFERVFFEKALKPSNDFDDNVVLFFEPKSAKSIEAAKAYYERISQRLDATKIPAVPELFQRYFAASKGAVEDNRDLRVQYQTLEKSILVISGDHDISFALSNWYPLIGKSNSLQLIVLPEAGHGPHFQYPEVSAGYIKTFIDN